MPTIAYHNLFLRYQTKFYIYFSSGANEIHRTSQQRRKIKNTYRTARKLQAKKEKEPLFISLLFDHEPAAIHKSGKRHQAAVY